MPGILRGPKSVKSSDGWSFSLRGGDDTDSDGDDEDGTGATGAGAGLSNDAQLLQELDISAREETVQYKANPWSIARVNAASRPTKAKSPPRAPVKKAGGNGSSTAARGGHGPGGCYAREEWWAGKAGVRG